MADDPDNATISGEVYKNVVYTDSVAIGFKWVYTDSVLVDSVWVYTDSMLSPMEWRYTDWYFTNPVESVQVWVESDENSAVPYTGPVIMGYTDSLGRFSIPIYLGHTYCDLTGYTYLYYADVRVFCIYKGGWSYDFGGGLTLKAGEEFKLFPICMEWPSPTE
jgi:hypothetical protein